MVRPLDGVLADQLRAGRPELIAAFAEHVLVDASLIDDARFVDNVDRIANVDALESIITTTFAAVPAAEIFERLKTGGVTHSKVNDPLALWQHEQLRARDRFMDVATPTGTAEMYKPPFNLSDMGESDQHVPGLGEDRTDMVARLLERGE